MKLINLLILFIILITLITLIILYREYKKNKDNYEEKYELVVASCFKNEGHILKEWVDHYLYHGVDHIYLINDGSNDNYQEILDPYIKNGYVTLFNNTKKIDTYPRQSLIYKEYLEPLLSNSKWWAILDLDEFLYSPKDINLKNIIKKYDNENISQIHGRWVMYGSSGNIEQPKLVVPNFLKRKSNIENQVKSIFKGKDLVKFDVHVHDVKKNSIIANENDLLINHYAIQSWKFFERVKMTRGDLDLYAQTVGVVRDKAYFDKYDYNDIEDNRLAIQNSKIF